MQKVRSAVVYQFVYQFVNIFAAVLTGYLMGLKLTASEIGVLTLVSSVQNSALSLVDNTFGRVFQKNSVFLKSKNKILLLDKAFIFFQKRKSIYTVLVSLLILVFYSFSYAEESLSDSESFFWILLILPLTIYLMSRNTGVSIYLQATDRHKEASFVLILPRLMFCVSLCVLFLLNSFSVELFVLFVFFSYFFSVCYRAITSFEFDIRKIKIFSAKKRRRIESVVNKSLGDDFKGFNFYVYWIVPLSVAIGLIDYFIIGFVLGLNEVGWLGAIQRLLLPLSLITSTASPILWPLISAMDSKSIFKGVGMRAVLFCVLLFFGFVLYVALTPYIFNLFFPRLVIDNFILIILLCSIKSFIAFFIAALKIIAFKCGGARLVFGFYLFLVPIFALSSFYFTRQYGIVGSVSISLSLDILLLVFLMILFVRYKNQRTVLS